jgi:hypothetical protein
MPSYFTLGISINKKDHIAYHLKDEYWSMCDFAITLEKSPIEGTYNSKIAL